MTDPCVFLIKDPAVLAELELSSAQHKKIAELLDDLDVPLFALRDYHPDDTSPRTDELIRRLETVWGEIMNTLTPLQRSRLQQICWRSEGSLALARPEPARRLGLRPDQREQIREITEKARGILQRLNSTSTASTGEVEATTRARQIVRTEQEKAIRNVLTDAQVRRWTRLLGRPFDFSQLKPVGFKAPDLREVDAWINTSPVTLAQLRGQVVVLHFWTFGCVNCVRNWPVYKRWAEAYANRELKIIGIHTPETANEHLIDKVRQTAAENNLSFPIAVDNRKRNWLAWSNRVWPSVYLIDKSGRVRYWWYGELNWNQLQGERFMQQHIDTLLTEEVTGQLPTTKAADEPVILPMTAH